MAKESFPAIFARLRFTLTLDIRIEHAPKDPKQDTEAVNGVIRRMLDA